MIPRSSAILVAVALLCAAACGQDEGGALPDTADAAPRPDVPVTPDAPTSPDAPSHGCTDPHEPNDWMVTATPAPQQPVAAVLCAGDVDLYAIPPGTTAVVSARLDGVADGGALRLALVAAATRTAPTVDTLAEAAWDGAALTLAAEVGAGTFAFLRVDGAAATDGVPYRLEVRIDQGACVDDPYEPNDTEDAAVPTAPQAVVEAGVCPADEDWWSVAVPPDTHLRVVVAPQPTGSPALGPVLEGWVGGAQAGTHQGPDGPGIAVEAAPGARTLLIRVSAVTGAQGVRYTLRTETWAQGPTVAGSVVGMVRYEDLIPTRNGYANGPWLPAGRVRVEAVRSFDEAVAASAVTDEEGHYALDVSLDVPPEIRVRALTESLDAEGPAVTVRTGVDEASPPFALSSPPFQLRKDGASIDLLASRDAGGGAFNALDVARRAFAFVAQELGEQPDPLAIAWSPGAAEPCGTCYLGDLGVLALSGTIADDDAYDDAVVAHEVGHHFELHHGVADSPGGYHDGRRTDPRLAWSEGFANAFAAMVLDDPLYVDVAALGVTLVLDLESVSHDQAYGTHDGTMAGAVSEDLVAAVLWDLHDTGAESLDPASSPAGVLLRPSLDWFHGPVDRGFPGVDLVDHLDGVLCRGLIQTPWVDVVAVQQRKFPHDLDPGSDSAADCD